MVQAVAFPNIPQGQVTLAAVSEKSREVLQALEQTGIEPLRVGASPHLPLPVCSHADMRLHPMGGGEVVVEVGDTEFYRSCAAKGLHVRYAAWTLGQRYPQDIGLNCFALGGRLIGLPKAMDPAVRDRYLEKGFRLLGIRQGYAKCSAAIVSHHAVITSDPSLAKALPSIGVDCLSVSPGYVRLDGYAYGFLGGACFLSSPHTLCFLGELSSHPDAQRIRAFCFRHNVETRSLLKGELRDVGSVLPLYCRDPAGL